MRVLRDDPKAGTLRLRVETPSDLWRLSRLVRIGDGVGASTTRRDPEAPEEVAAAERVRRRVWLVVRAEECDLPSGGSRLRIRGPIAEGPFDLGRSHTLEIGVGDEVELRKTAALSAAERALLEEGTRREGEPMALVASVDWGESTVARIRGRSIEPVADVNRTLSGKGYGAARAGSDREAYLAELAGIVLRAAEGAATVVVCGPGFLKESLAREIGEREPALRGKVRVYPTAEGGRPGLDELLRSGRASEALGGAIAAEEATLIEKVLEGLRTGRRAAVGRIEVGEAVDARAVESLLVSESLLTDPAVAPLLDRARHDRARILVVEDRGTAGTRLAGLGGIAAVLRYDWVAPSRAAGDRRPP
ncbi:MAG: hypothetical protein QXG65_01545 [Thermoplasmata archaeon]